MSYTPAHPDGAELAIRDFWRRRTAINSTQAARFHSEHDAHDIPAITALCAPGARVLDLGCGTCVVANWLATNHEVTVHAVDYMPVFLEHAIEDPRVTTAVGDARTYRCDGRFDLILSLGVITYFVDREERRAMYENCLAMLAPGGSLFLKAQFGVRETVTVDTYSEQLQARYVASYPWLDDEVALLEGVFDSPVAVTDPFPPELNLHDNTHFYYLSVGRSH
ncbi:MAG TPA: class I SAM-dependent methyltransferase [Solirubrobacteraceae bacterium]|nr:class I SAM-dependent methyltransferase [Solirubrobacteraceae bacterium]